MKHKLIYLLDIGANRGQFGQKLFHLDIQKTTFI